MKLILASDQSFLTKYGYDLIGIPKDKVRIGYVTTASKVVRHPEFFENVRKDIAASGYAYHEIDIAGKREKELRDFFADKNVIHVEGGNTFYLLKTVRETGFDALLKEFIVYGKKVYIGTSAGSYLMCPTIEVADWNKSGKDKFGVTDFTALNYVPFVLKVHYTDDKKEAVLEGMRTLRHSLRILKDGQGILVEDGNCTFTGDGEEVKFTPF